MTGGDAVLEWTYNPWREKGGPAWRRPWFAALLILAIAAIAGISFTYPNASREQIDLYRESLETGIWTPGAGGPDSEPRSLREDERIARQELIDYVDNWGMHAIAWGALSLAFLFGMNLTLFVPTTYRLDSEGVTVRYLGTTGFRKWGHYRNYYFHDTGVHMTTMPQPSRLDPFRGHFLRYSNNREAVNAYITEHMKEWKGKPAV